MKVAKICSLHLLKSATPFFMVNGFVRSSSVMVFKLQDFDVAYTRSKNHSQSTIAKRCTCDTLLVYYSCHKVEAAAMK